MQIDVLTIAKHPFWIPVSVLGLFLIKVACLYPLLRLFKIQRATSMDVSVRMAQAGEFALLMLGIAMASQIIPKDSGQFFLLVASLSIFTTPLLTRQSPVLIRIFHLNRFDAKEVNTPVDDKIPPAILIAGYGRIGRLVGGILERQRIPFIAIEHNFEHVKILKKQGHRVIYADARKIDIWRKLYEDSVKSIVITIEQPEAAEMILKSLRAEWPHVHIIVRTHDTDHMERLYDLGATYAIPEALEASMMMASKTLQSIGMDQDSVAQEIDYCRKTAILRHSDM
jgi:CPA2 family monovalent cation:H+ antiporter-2